MKIVSYFILCLFFEAENFASDLTNNVYMTSNIIFALVGGDSPKKRYEFRANEQIHWEMVGTSTNYAHYRHLPSGNLTYRLYDEQGKQVPQTIASLAKQKLPILPFTNDAYALNVRHNFPSYSVDIDGGEVHSLWKADDVFLITNKGVYELELQKRIYVMMSNGVPVEAAFTNAENFTYPIPVHPEKFGIFTSPPIRVRIIKE